ncbi:MAG: molecular chaperone DnaK [Acidobacteriota bacterium]|jgi:uncharacterized protein (TIGR02266 family)|nr:molecular chaperone DnaK [Acidobacteriota bacterium]
MSEYSASRDSQRVPLETRVQLKFEWFGGFISEYSSNISPGGMFIRTQTPEPVGRLIGFELRLGDGYELIRGNGEVVWARPLDQGPDKPAGMGIRFLEISPAGRELIYQMVDNYIAQGGIPFDVTQMPGGAPEPTLARSELPDLPDLVTPPEDAEAPATVDAVPPPALPAEPALAAVRAELPWPAAVLEHPAPAPVRAMLPPELAPDRPEPLAPAFGAMPSMPAMSAVAAEDDGPRRGSRLVLWTVLGGVLVLLAALAVFKQDVFLGWFLPAKRPQAASAAAAPAGRPSRREPPPPAAPVSAPPVAAVATEAAPTASSPPPPQAVQALPSPSPAPVPSATAATDDAKGAGPGALQKITWKQGTDGTEVVLWADGGIRRQDWAHYRIDGDPPRELIKLYGIGHPFATARLVAGTEQLLQVRTGSHAGPKGNELHVVLDLTGPGVEVTGIEAQGGELHVHLKGK